MKLINFIKNNAREKIIQQVEILLDYLKNFSYDFKKNGELLILKKISSLVINSPPYNI